MSSTMTVGEERYQVFLGGSCGGRKSPTTWRQEVAIPLLQENRVKFFNPQVEAWSHDLIHKENSAKDNSEWLLFMLEASTRGIASMVEVAHLVGLRRPVVFVLQKERESGHIDIPDDSVSSLEIDDIRCSQALLHTVIEKEHTSKYCSVLKDGLQHVINASKQQSACRGCSSTAAGREKKRFHLSWDILALITHKAAKTGRLKPTNLKVTIPPAISSISSARHHQRALAIIGADGIDNIANMAEERLRQYGVASPVVLIEKDAVFDVQALSASCVLLAFIPSNLLSCATMCKTAFMLAMHKEMVVCVQDFSCNTVIANTSFSAGAVSDYNRARAYLRDIASRRCREMQSDLDRALDVACKRTALATVRLDSGNNNEVGVSPVAATPASNSNDGREGFWSSLIAGSSRKAAKTSSESTMSSASARQCSMANVSLATGSLSVAPPSVPMSTH